MNVTRYQKSKQEILAQLNRQLLSDPDVKNIHDLKFVMFTDTKSITTFEPIRDFPNIEHIRFDLCRTIKSITGIENLPRLKSLHFGPKVVISSGIESIFKISTLERLCLPSGFEYLVNLQPSVNELILLQDKIEYIPEVPANNAVIKLWIGNGKHQITNLYNLKYYPYLKELNVSRGELLYSLSGIENCNNLEVLYANFTNISTLSHINTNKLRELRVRQTNINSFDTIKPSMKLQKLYAEKTNVKSIERIKELMPNLELLWIFDTKVKDLTPLQDMAKIKELVLIRMKGIRSWVFLRSMPMLTTLDLHKTSFSDIDLLLNIKKLKYVLLSGTKIDQHDPRLERLDSYLKTHRGGYSFNPVGQWIEEIDDELAKSLH